MYDVPFSTEPIDEWPGELATDRQASTFRAAWGDTVLLLDRELRMIGADRVVMQVAMQPGDFRLDGRPRARATADHPGVILSFDSDHGTMRWAVDTFTTWQDNVRAIALTLEKLRAVSRYGAVKDSAQYRGFRQIGTGGEARRRMTWDEAATFMRKHGAVASGPVKLDMTSRHDVDTAYRAAARRLHPDAGGDANLFAQLTEARELLTNHQEGRSR